MIRRVRVEPFELLGVIRGAVFRNPKFCDLEVLIAQHIEQRYLADDRTEQIRPLRDHRAHEQAAVGTALDGEVTLVGVFLRDEILAGSDEVVKYVLLLLQHAGAMPIFTELGPAAQVGNRENAAVLHPEISAAVETWRLRDVKTAVAGQQGWVLAVLLYSLFADDKHRDLRAIFRAVPDLLHVISGRIDGGRVNLGPERAVYAGPIDFGQVNAINRRWHGEGLESEEDLVAVIPAGGAENSSDGGQRNVGELLAVEPEHFKFRSRIVLVLRQELAAGHARLRDAGGRLGDNFLPILALDMGRVGDKNAIVGCVFVGGDVEFAGKEVGAVKKIFAGSDLDRRIFRLQIFQIHFRLGPAFANINQQPAVIFGESDVRSVLRIAAFTEYEWILGGIGSELVVENLDVVNLFSIRHLAFLGIASVVEGGAVLHPGHAGEACALDGIGQQFTGRAFDDMERALFRSAGRRPISNVLSVFRRIPPVEGNGPVGRELVDVEEHAVVIVQSLAHIKDGLVLVAFAAGMEIVLTPQLRNSDGPNLKQLREARIDLVAPGQRVENGARVAEFLIDVALGVGIIRILEIAVGIDDLVTLNRVLDRGNFGFRRTDRKSTRLNSSHLGI